jgi:hypothetical protein
MQGKPIIRIKNRESINKAFFPRKSLSETNFAGTNLQKGIQPTLERAVPGITCTFVSLPEDWFNERRNTKT